MPGPRKYLWYLAFLVVLPTWGYGLRSGILPLALLGLPAFVMLIFFSFTKRICSGCGKALRIVNAKLTNCPYCGEAYDEGS